VTNAQAALLAAASIRYGQSREDNFNQTLQHAERFLKWLNGKDMPIVNYPEDESN